MFKILIVSLCLAVTLAADENAALEDPSGAKIDPLIHVKEQLAQARIKGWNSSTQQKNKDPKKAASDPEFSMWAGPISPNKAMEPSEGIARFSESDCSKRQTAELCK